MYIGAASSVDVSTLLGLTRFLTDTLENIASFSDANIVALINQDQREVQAFLLSQIMYEWKENATDGTGGGLINLVAGTNYAAFPTDMLTLDRAEINYTGAANGWVPLTIVKMNSIDQAIANTSGNSAVKGSKNNPICWVRNGRIYIDPIPDATVTGGLKVWCTTLVTDLVVGTSTTSLPVFLGSFHHVLALNPAIKWLNAKKQFDKAKSLINDRANLLGQMVDLYSKRDSDTRPRMVSKPRNTR